MDVEVAGEAESVRATQWIRESSRFLRAQVSSLLATAVDWALMLGALLLGWHYLIAVAVGHVAGALTDFAVKKYWAFGAEGGRVDGQLLRYFVAWVGSLGLNELAAWFLIEQVHVAKGAAVIAASLVIGFAWNYPMHRWYVFGHRLRLKDRGEQHGAS